jgi:Fe-Mn family superoxide dismutase
MQIHHSKHHQAYVDNLNKAVKGTKMESASLIDLMLYASFRPDAVRNNAGGHYNHSLFWEIMAANAGGNPIGEVAKAIETDLGGFDKFKTDFSQAGATRFGSGWAWLYLKSDGKLAIGSTANQDNPLMDLAEGIKGTPILGMDVWEHAYYLHYQNRRPDYMAAFFNVINWNKVNELYLNAKK